MTTREQLIEALRARARKESLFGNDVRNHLSEQAADMLEADGASVVLPKTYKDIAVFIGRRFESCHEAQDPNNDTYVLSAQNLIDSFEVLRGAVAPRVEPPEMESGGGFESLPAPSKQELLSPQPTQPADGAAFERLP